MDNINIKHGCTALITFEISNPVEDIDQYDFIFHVKRTQDSAVALIDKEVSIDPVTNRAEVQLDATDWVKIPNKTGKYFYGTRIKLDADHDYPFLQGEFNVGISVAVAE